MAQTGPTTPCSQNDWESDRMQKVLIIGATSAIAEATARLLAEQGDQLFLLARNSERMISLADDLKIRGAGSVLYDTLDVNDFDRHQAALDQAVEQLGGIDIALIAHGTLPDQKACERDANLTQREINTNAISTISLLTHLANVFEKQGKGTIAVISSVAGDRGRQSNYVYGAAKGMVSIFLQGLRHRLHRSGIRVLTIKPGLIDTPMTAGFKKGFLWTGPDGVARAIMAGIEKGREEVYAPFFWRPIMMVIRHLPGFIFNRTGL